MGNANKAATYDRATAAVNEAPRAPGSPALAVPKAPRAPAAPRLEEDDVDQPDGDFDSWEQNGDTAVPVTNGGVRQNLYKTPVSQVPQGAKITQKYNTYQQQGAHAFPVEPQGGIDQLSKIPLSQVPKGASIVQAPTPAGNLYKNLPAAPALDEDDEPVDMDLVRQIYKNNQDVIGPNPNLIYPKTVIDLPDGTPYEIRPGDTLSKIAKNIPAIKADAAVSNAFVATEPTWMDKLKKAGTGLLAGELPSQAIGSAFPSLKKRTPIAAPVDKIAAGPVVKAPPEMVAPADSMDPGEEIVVKSKVKPQLPPRTPSPEPFMPPVAQPAFPHVPSPQPFMPAGANPERPKRPYVPTPRPTGKEPEPTDHPTGIAAAADKTSRVINKVEKGAEEWFGNKVATRAETPGSADPYHQPNIAGSGAYGKYQFMEPTFNGLVKLANPGDPLYGKTFKDFKNDPTLQDATMKTADKYYTDVLSRSKVPTTDGNKYLAHFVGAENAVNMINNTSAKTPLKDLYHDRELKNGETVPNDFFTRNKFPTDMTVGDLRKWAQHVISRNPEEKKKTKESAVYETVQTVKVMLETATTRDDVRRIKDYIDRQYTRHGLTDPVSFAQRNHLVERVIEITAKRLLQT